MQTFNNYAEMAAAQTTQDSVRPMSSAITNNTKEVKPMDKDQATELIFDTITDVMQLKGLMHLCPDYTPIAKFAMNDDALRLAQVTLVNPEYAELVRNSLNDD